MSVPPFPAEYRAYPDAERSNLWRCVKRADGNWRWRYTDDMLSASAFQSLTDLTHASARSGGMETPRTHDLPALLSPEVTR
jgi:hypothetical protein